jgi:hypothetical protein
MPLEPPPLPGRPPLPVLADFGDWLSPMIVKELRQGLRTWIFVGSFIVLQAVLVMTLMISSSSGNEEAASYFFWMLVAFILVFVVPLRGYNALAGEIKGQTLDALVLTRLSAFRIAFGKWAALVLQAALIAISVLPYVVLRYFGGGVNLLSELRGLFLFWMLSAAMASVAVACSALSSVIIRTLLLLGTWWWAIVVCWFLTAVTMRWEEMGFLGGIPPQSFWLVLFFVLIPLWIYGCYFVIDMGASTIAPIAANHATRKRLISLALIILALVVTLVLDDNDGRRFAFACLVAIWALSSLDCLTETPTTAVSVFAPFVARRFAGRAAAWLLAPGWPTGLLFYLLTGSLVFAGWAGSWEFWQPDAEDFLAAGNVAGCALAPLALALVCFRRQPRLLEAFVVCALILVIFGALIMFMTEVSNENDVAFLGIVSPPSALMSAAVAGHPVEEAILAGGLVTSAASLAAVLLYALPHYRAMRAVMREAAEVA